MATPLKKTSSPATSQARPRVPRNATSFDLAQRFAAVPFDTPVFQIERPSIFILGTASTAPKRCRSFPASHSLIAPKNALP